MPPTSSTPKRNRRPRPIWVLFLPHGLGRAGHTQVAVEIRGVEDHILDPLIEEAMQKWRGFNQGRSPGWRLVEFWKASNHVTEVEVWAQQLAQTLKIPFKMR